MVRQLDSTTYAPCPKCGSIERRPRGNCAQCHRDAAARYRQRVRSAEGNHKEIEWLNKAASYSACPKCNRSWDEVERPPGQTKAFTKGHIVPLAQGGRNSLDNLQPECARCNYGDHGANLTRRGRS